VGIAIDEGLIGSIEDLVTQYLPELVDRDPRFERITIRHLLTMSSGDTVVVRLGRDWGVDNSTWRTTFREIADHLAGEPER
jgi:CubicO group peptidase (beta-lactamase class C family)